jgi:beta-phosphoglucomutase-like phosphatase (HAD superfamily)
LGIPQQRFPSQFHDYNFQISNTLQFFIKIVYYVGMVKSPNIQAVLWDVDEVVVASTPLQVQAEQVAAREMAQAYQPAVGYESLTSVDNSEIDWTEFKGMARVAIAAKIWGIESGNPLADEYRLNVVRATVEVANPDIVPFVEGAEDGLVGIRASGIPMAAVTSSHRNIYSAYDQILNLGRFFDQSVTYGEAAHNKPQPHPYLLAAARLGVAVENTVVIEDSGSGIRSGLAAGATVIGLATTIDVDKLQSLGVHYAVRDWQELTTQINQLTNG